MTVPREESRCKDMIYKLSMFEPLGYFHSHPECDPIPTKDDVQSMKINDIELIVTIEKKGRNMPWRYDASKSFWEASLENFGLN
ncbi:MAG: hypothetical protein QXR45_13355 [Candidatus Bathyarchaeia archaeon]